MVHQIFTRSLLAAAVLGAYTHGFAADEVSNTELETVSVVGSINKLQAVPFRQAKSAVNISAETLSEEGVEKMDEIGRYQAGFTNQPFGSDTNTNWFRIRGTEASQSVDGSPAVSYGFFTPHAEVYGIEAVEVTKGADSMTFGAANAGGLINYISKRPHKNQVGHGDITAHVGTDNQRGLAADYTGSLNADQSLRYRLVGSYRKADGEWNGTGAETYYLAPSLAWDISDRTRFTLLASYQKDVGTPSSNFLPQDGSLFDTVYGKIDPNTNLGAPDTDSEKNIQKSIGYEFSHDFDNGLTFSQNYRYSHVKSNHFGAYVYPANYDANWNAFSWLDNNGMLTRGYVYNNGTAKSHSIDNRLTWQFKNDAVENTLLGGIDYRHQKIDALYTTAGSATDIDVLNPGAYSSLNITPTGSLTGIKSRQLGFYLQNNLRLYKRVGITAGIRHDRAKNEEVTSAQSVEKNHTSYSGSLMYFGNYGLNPYISYNESFRLPNGLSGNQTLYDPYITKQYEVGLKYLPSWLDGKMSVALFKAKDEGALLMTAAGNTVSNEDPVKRKGVEIQADANITDNISAAFAYTYLSSVTDSSSGKVNNPLIPKHSASARVAYAFDSGSLNGLKVGTGIRYVGNSYTAAGSLHSNVKVPSSTVWDLFARYDINRNWVAQINADNVTNRKYVAACDYYCYYGQGRSVVGSISYKF